MDTDQPENSPTGILLPELLSEIFSFTVSPPPESSFTPSDSYPRLREALVLSSVSRTWRAVAHSTLSLWASLGVETLDTGRIYPRLSLVENWVDRSASCPLNLTFNVEREGSGVERLVLLIKTNRARLRSLQFVWFPFQQFGRNVMNVMTEEDTMPEVFSLSVANTRMAAMAVVKGFKMEIKIP